MEGLAIDRAAPVARTQLDDTSWVDVVPAFVREPHEAFARFESDTRWTQAEVLRYDRYVPEKRLGAWVRPDNDTMLRQAELHLRSAYRQALEGVTAILYRDGDDFQGLHSDREMRWLDDTLIAIVVLGERRPFVLRPRGSWQSAAAERVPAGSGERDIVLMPGQGDLIVMGGRCQADWLHGIPATTTTKPRISLTWRWTARIGRPDTAPGYFDGRHFSGAPPRVGHRTRPVRR